MKRSSTEMCAELREFDNAHGSTEALAWGKESTFSAEDMSLIPGSRRSPEGGNGNPLQHSCLEHPMDRGACWAAVHGVAKNQT